MIGTIFKHIVEARGPGVYYGNPSGKVRNYLIGGYKVIKSGYPTGKWPALSVGIKNEDYWFGLGSWQRPHGGVTPGIDKFFKNACEIIVPMW